MREDLDRLRSAAESSARESTLLARFDEFARRMPDRGRIDALGEELSALRRTVEQDDDGGRTEARLELLGQQLAELREIIENEELPRAEARFDALGDQLATLRHVIENEEVPRAQARFDALGDQLASLRHHIENEEAPRTAARFEAIGRDLSDLRALVESDERDATGARLDALAGEVAALRGVLESDDSPRAVARAELRVNELVRTVENTLSKRETATAAAQAGVAASLADIRGALEDLAGGRLADRNDGPVAMLAADLADIRGALEQLIAGGGETPLQSEVAALAASLVDIKAALETRDGEGGGSAAIDRLERRLDAIASGLDQILDRVAPAATVNDLDQRLTELAAQIDTISRETIEQIDARAEELVEQTRLASHPGIPADQLAEIEQRITRLSGEIDRATPRAAALSQVEADLMRLQAHLSNSRQDSVDAAKVAARDAVRELAGRETASDIILALRRDLDGIRETAGSSDRHTEATLQSLHSTLATIVERLARVEREAGRAEAQPAAAAPAAPASPATNRGPIPVATRLQAKPAVAAESVDADVSALREITAAAAESDRKTGDRRADFIAAARRAAHAATAEAGPSPARETKADDQKPGAFARIGQAIRNRRRTLLLAAAVIILAVGTLQILGPRLLGKGAAVASASPGSAAPAGQGVKAPAKPAVAARAETPFIPSPDKAALIAPPADARTAMALASADTGTVDPGTPEISVTEDGSIAPAAANPGGPAPVGPDTLRTAALAGDGAAAFEVATRYAEGKGTARDLAAAVVWYQRAAAKSVVMAEYRLGSLYERGQGVTADKAQAISWYQRAADQGNVGAMHNLAVMLSQGVNGTPDNAKALEWFLAAANYGVKDSQYNLGVIYARGLGRAPDLAQSYKWFAIAAAGGDADASARRDEVAAQLPREALAAAQAEVAAWHAKTPAPEANSVATPDGGWGDAEAGITEADQKALVAKIQTLLADQGYDPGPPDGVDGPKTREAVRAFQRSIGVADTGEINPKLVTALADRSG